MIELLEIIIPAIAFVVLVIVGLVFGSQAERRHFRDLQQREQNLGQVLITQLRSFPFASPNGKTPRLVMAETVIASDYLKTFLAQLRNIFGGEVRSFESLLERARREVTLRLKEQAIEMGYNAVCNVRLTSVNIAGLGPRRGAMATIIGYATAYECAEPPGDVAESLHAAYR